LQQSQDYDKEIQEMLNDLTSSKARPKGSKNNSLNGSQDMGNSLK